MTHDEAFRTPEPVFTDPAPGCRAALGLVSRDAPALNNGGWGAHVQEVYICRGCGCRIGMLDGRLVWAERRARASPPATGGGHREGPGEGPRGPGPRSRDRGGPDSPYVRQTLGAIRSLSDAEGRCQASNAAIEETAGLTRRSVQYALAHLEAAGLIRFEGGRRACDGRVIVVAGQAPPGPPPADPAASDL